ncbi:Uncharacterised protein [Klebsiella pneumoniae]|uniref:hypothetical protein n=1 Tax=Klebsiella pneumoniae TaxID=573 RepID=UPI000E2A9038|nr:hypothetical protein [Klebsiella pneumoniae]HDU4506632.1 hypothetical protein [Klebsiella pneumoniae subsp. pneumoniae]MCU8619966.1 hypothetical protein [Klebsiella pneumoniae]SXG40271.1 Uncharacterised protein [Klebsiella pneumoniae]VGB84932.1 Uncharacterised protein [Klebsiella pneumoniae]VGC76047.1 Uncharacterised protein [Klebsiella pneumoniae]
MHTLYMIEAKNVFEALRKSKIDSFVRNEHLGLIGAEHVDLWYSNLGGTLEFISANGGCQLNIYPPSMSQQEATLQDAAKTLIQVLDDYSEQLVPVDRNSAVVRELRNAISY